MSQYFKVAKKFKPKSYTEKYYYGLVSKALVDGDDMEKYFEYVIDTYGNEWWSELLPYDENFVIKNIKEVFKSL